jgi:hypothetical protein
MLKRYHLAKFHPKSYRHSHTKERSKDIQLEDQKFPAIPELQTIALQDSPMISVALQLEKFHPASKLYSPFYFSHAFI